MFLILPDANQKLTLLKQSVPLVYALTKHINVPLSEIEGAMSSVFESLKEESFYSVLDELELRIPTLDDDNSLLASMAVFNTGYHLCSSEFVEKLECNQMFYHGVDLLCRIYGERAMSFLRGCDLILVDEYNSEEELSSLVDRMLTELNNKVLLEHDVLFGIRYHSIPALCRYIKVALTGIESTGEFSDLRRKLETHKYHPKLTLQNIVNWCNEHKASNTIPTAYDLITSLGIE